MAKAVVTSKGQITIPKNIRDYLRIDTGDVVGFDPVEGEEKRTVVMMKEQEVVICPVCKGKGYVENDQSKQQILRYPCMVCDEEGRLVQNFEQEISKLVKVCLKHKISCLLDGIGVIPLVVLKGAALPKNILAKFNDYYQLRYIEEMTPKNADGKYVTPTKLELSGMKGSLQTEEAKKKLKETFDEGE